MLKYTFFLSVFPCFFLHLETFICLITCFGSQIASDCCASWVNSAAEVYRLAKLSHLTPPSSRLAKFTHANTGTALEMVVSELPQEDIGGEWKRCVKNWNNWNAASAIEAIIFSWGLK